MSTQLADPQDLAIRLGLDESDPLLELALRRASNRFRGAVGFPVTLTSETVILDGTGTDTLLLPAAPIESVDDVTIANTAVTDYTVSKRAGLLRRRGGWPDDLGNVVVTYTHGYLDIPGEIEDAVLEQAELQYRVAAGVQATSTGARSVTFGAQATVGVTQRWSDAVNQFKLNRGDRA